MTNVYNKTVFDRNSIQDIPSGYIDDASNNLLRFLGSFWMNIHEGRGLIRGLQNVRGIKVAQFYLNLLESLKLQDRNGLPVFHRELWKPLIIRASQKNTAQANILKLGKDVVLGEQESWSKYGEGTELNIGSLASLDNYVTYPVDGDINAIVSNVTNNIINPTVVYNVSSDFPSTDVIYINGSLIFPKDKDPFAENSGFEVYDVVKDVTDESDNDMETVVWASDVLIDKKFISDHMAYALGLTCSSTDVIKRILNAGWDSINCGLTPELFKTLIGAMVNTPVVQSAEETVTNVKVNDDNSKTVKTDKNTYTVYKDAKLRDCINVGTVLKRGDFIDQAIKIYPILVNTSEEKLSNTTEYADILKEDVPVISIPRSLVRTRTSNGLSVDWVPTNILWKNGDYDANGHRKLYFDITGPESDVNAFWNDVWDRAEQENIDLDDIFAECEYDESSSSSNNDQPWQIIPAAFFLKNMLGGNTLIVTMDRSQIEDSSLIRDQKFFNLLNDVIPSGMRLFFVEHVSAGDTHDEYNMEEPEDDTEYATGVVEEVDKYVLDDVDEDEYAYESLPGMKGKKLPTYEDEIEMKFLRNRKRSAE